MHYLTLFRGEYIAAIEMGDKTPTLTIRSVKVVGIEDENGQTRDRGVVYFREIERGWVLNRTNAICLATMFGPDTDDWEGKRVTLHCVEVWFGPQKVPGIRVKGSPDIDRDMIAEVRLPRRKPQKIRLERTGGQRPDSEPARDEDTTGSLAAMEEE